MHRPLLLPFVIALLLIPVSAETIEGQLVSSVRVEATGPVDETAIIEILELEVGRHLDKQRLREVIMTLYASGDVEWLRVESAESADGADVVIHIRFRSRLSKIEVHTKSPILKVKIHRWVQLEPGDPVPVAGIEVSRRRVERRLHDRGYADATVEAYLDFNRKTNTVAIEFVVVAGPPQVLAAVVLDGLADGDDAQAAYPKFKTGARLTTRLENRLRDRTEQNLRRMGYWEAEVLEIDRRVDGAGVTLHMRVESGPRYRLDLIAPSESQKIAEEAFPDPAKEELHPAQTEALAELVEESLQESGYLLAEVGAELHAEGNEQVLRLTVAPGRKLKISSLEFPGADHFSQKTLSETIRVKRGGVGGRFQQSVSNRTLESDRRAIEDLYKGEGFPFAVIAPSELAPVDDEDAVIILFPVDEGQRWFMAEVRVEGLPVEAAAELEARPLELAEGAPWSPGLVDRDVRRIEEALADTGYPEGSESRSEFSRRIRSLRAGRRCDHQRPPPYPRGVGSRGRTPRRGSNR